MSHRFRFFGTAQTSGWLIAGDEHTHLAKVLRLPVGSVIEVMDGTGIWCVGKIAEITASTARVEVQENKKDLPRAVKLIVALGALSHGEVDEVLSPLVELGVDEIIVFGQEDQGKSRLNEKAIERWQRMILSACKQCKRALVPKLSTMKSCYEVAAAGHLWESKFVGVADASSRLNTMQIRLVAGTTAGIVVGSEKGLSEEELNSLLEHGFLPVRLGSHVLRAKTAAIACTAVLTELLTV